MSIRVLVLFLMLLPLPAMAMEPMVGAELTWMRIGVAGENFNPLAARARLALAITPEWEIGVTGGKGIADDKTVSVTTAIDRFGEACVRYSSSLDENARLVLSAGYGTTTLDITSTTSGVPGLQTYRGVTWGISLQERLAAHPRWTGSLDYERWFNKDDLSISTLSYGFRYGF